jgi:uncharacterized protein DUF6627
MGLPRRLRFWSALLMLVYWSGLQVAPAVAGLAPSRLSGETTIASARDADLLLVQRVLEHRVVAQKLRDYGLTADEVRLKVAALSDQELHQLASVAHGLPTGADDLGVLITVLLIILLVILIVKLLNKDIVIR